MQRSHGLSGRIGGVPSMGFTADAEQSPQGYLASRHGDELAGKNSDDPHREAAVIDWRMFVPWKQKKSPEARNLESSTERLLQAVKGMDEALSKQEKSADD